MSEKMNKVNEVIKDKAKRRNFMRLQDSVGILIGLLAVYGALKLL